MSGSKAMSTEARISRALSRRLNLRPDLESLFFFSGFSGPGLVMASLLQQNDFILSSAFRAYFLHSLEKIVGFAIQPALW